MRLKSVQAMVSLAYEVVGIGFHPMHLYFATEGSTIPADAGTFGNRIHDRFGIRKTRKLARAPQT